MEYTRAINTDVDDILDTIQDLVGFDLTRTEKGISVKVKGVIELDFDGEKIIFKLSPF